MNVKTRLTIALLSALAFVLSVALTLYFFLRSATPRPRARSFL